MGYYSSSRYTRAVDDLGATLGGAIVLMAIVLIVIVGWLLVKAANLLARVFQKHGDVRALWVALFVCLGAWVLAGLGWALPAGKQDPTIAVSLTVTAVVCTLALLVVARYIELRADTLFQRERTRETLIQDVLTRSWWKSAA